MLCAMSLGAKVMLAIIVLPILGVFVWSTLQQSIVRIPPGRLGLLVIKGRPTDTSLLPGAHWVPALRKRFAVEYPAVELSYRAVGQDGGSSSSCEAAGPALRATLGDRAEAVVSFTVRFRLDPQRLRTVHERFGPDGIWAVVRDDSARAVRAALADPEVTLDSAYALERDRLEERLGAAVAAALDADGMQMTAFSLGAVDFGRSGEVVQAAVRARLELQREEAEAATRLARVRHDAELAPFLVAVDEAALRYRQADVWRDLVERSDGVTVAVPGPGGAPAPAEPEVSSEPAGGQSA